MLNERRLFAYQYNRRQLSSISGKILFYSNSHLIVCFYNTTHITCFFVFDYKFYSFLLLFFEILYKDSIKELTKLKEPEMYFDSYNTDIYRVIQTLTTLNLTANTIDTAGTQYLANALKHNKVRSVFCSSIL